MILFKKFLEGTVITLPRSRNLSFNWNFGSILGLTLSLQLVTGLLASCFYANRVRLAFYRVNIMAMDVDLAWFLRSVHANGASLFFMAAYLHVGRGLYYKSFRLNHTWASGVVIIIILMATGFVGYVLPWGQIRFWGATVIIRIASAIPWVGKTIVQCIWGDYSVRGITLTRLYTAHFLLPFILAFMSVIHLFFLHTSTSNNPALMGSFYSKTRFHPLFSSKDILGLLFGWRAFFSFCLLRPNYLVDSENFLNADPLVTPTHIKPEWYFLYAYAILRCIPNKLGGVVMLIIRILVLLFPIRVLSKRTLIRNLDLYPHKKVLIWAFLFSFLLLTWLGGALAETPYNEASQIISVVYFLIMLVY